MKLTPEEAGIGAIIAVWVLAVLVGLGFWVAVIWAIVQLVNKWT